MDIDERQEALARMLESLGGLQRENEKRLAQVTHDFETTLDSIKRLEMIATSRRPDR